MNAPFKESNAPFGHEHGPMLTGPFAPVLEEQLLTDLPVKGKIRGIRKFNTDTGESLGSWSHGPEHC